jgi:ABC-type multidrug transport system permease subunit
MARLALLIGWKDCLVRFQSRVTLIFVVVLPLAMTIVSGLAFQGFEAKGVEAKVALVGSEAAELWQPPPAHIIVERDLSDADARKAVEAKEIDGAIIVGPRGPITATAELVVHANKTPQRAIIEVAYSQLVEVLGHGRSGANVKVEPQQTTVGKEDVAPGFDSFSQAVTGNGVMFILLNCITAAGISVVRERRQNTLARLLISPVSRTTLLLGKMLGVFFVGVAQALVIFGFGAAMGVLDGDTAGETTKNIVGVSLVTLLLIVVACGMGLTVSTMARREETAESLGVPIAIVLTAMGGGMFPVERGPEWMQFVAKLLPTGWAMDAYHQLLWFKGGLSSIGLHLLVLAGFAVAFFALGTRRLRWE